MKKPQVILVSLDALSNTELPIMKTLPNFQKIIENGAHCEKMYSVYPSLTFPCHATMVTGCRPATHGIVNNFKFDPFDDRNLWNFYADQLKVKALWDYANDNDKTVLSLSWPVSAGADIKYSLPEMTPAKPKIWNAANFFRQLKVWFKYGTPSLALRSVFSNFKFTKSWFFGTQPDLDMEMIKLLMKSLDRYDTDLTLFHIYGLDDSKHNYGMESEKNHVFLKIYDDFLGELMEHVDKRNLKGENVNLLVTGDHSQRNISKGIYPNNILQKMGLIEYDNDKRKLNWWKAFFHSGDGMGYIYINDKENEKEIISTIYEKFKNHPGIEKIFTNEESKKLGANNKAALVFEAKNGYGFLSNYSYDNILDENAVTVHPSKALHGYLPDIKDYQTLFFAYGKNIKNIKIDDMGILDLAPTICHILKMEENTMEGKAKIEMLKDV